MSVQKYPNYKNSGVTWLGEIPAHWEVKRLKFHAEVIPSNVDKKSYDDELPVSLCNYTDVYYNDIILADMEFMQATATFEQVQKYSLIAGDIIITKDSESADDIAIPAFVPQTLPNVVCGYHLSIIRTGSTLDGKYAFHYFLSTQAKSYFETRANGLTRVGLGQAAIGNLPTPLPPLAEQEAIAAFLDRECARIDELVTAQQRMVALLREKRQAVIAHAVTRGLDPAVALRDSGVAWLGQVPAHWEVVRAKYLFSKMERVVREDDEIVTCFRDGMVTLRSNRRADGFTEATVFSGYQGIRKGDLVIHGMDAFAGAIGVSDSDGKATPVYNVCLPKQGVNAYFFSHLIRLMAKGKWILALSKGVRERTSDFRYDTFGEQLLVLPTTEEQQKIVSFIAAECTRIDALISAAERAVVLLQERRSAVIAAAVTGQIRVG